MPVLRITRYWWCCHLCADRMAESCDPAAVMRDRDAHLRKHAEASNFAPSFNDTTLSHWTFEVEST